MLDRFVRDKKCREEETSLYFNYSRSLNLILKFNCHHGNKEPQQRQRRGRDLCDAHRPVKPPRGDGEIKESPSLGVLAAQRVLREQQEAGSRWIA
ncbi:hypothetical protein EYF80_053067 [Liparis tanakae]|uniref:Uncharacterized protein n=1 Tax=Liparis tanakae TaxID=230148 RepID=A0A4Z2F7A1_9TELE|nr:hypothetical protein EYF80_053067 [Liparis tanakae]